MKPPVKTSRTTTFNAAPMNRYVTFYETPADAPIWCKWCCMYVVQESENGRWKHEYNGKRQCDMNALTWAKEK